MSMQPTATEILTSGRVLYDFHAMDSGPVRADFILVAGSHDLRVADRAAELWLDGAAPMIVCTGGGGKVTAGEWDRPEGTVFAERCIALGVEPACVLAETEATNTGENFTLTRSLLEREGQHVETGIIVSKTYMARRGWATGSKQWPLSRWSVRPPAIDFDDYPSAETPLERMLNLMVGDLQRLKVYADKGFQVPVDVPDNVWAAYEVLVDAGYDQFVIPED